MKFSQNCTYGLFDNILYRFVSQSSGSISRLIFPLLNYTIQNVSYSFIYVIAQSELYKLDVVNNNYVKVYSFKQYNNFTIYNYQNRLICIGFNSTSIINTTYDIIATIFYLKDRNGIIDLIGNQDLRITSEINGIMLKASPQLSKIMYFYRDTNNPTYHMIIKSIDYINNKVIDIDFPDSAHFF